MTNKVYLPFIVNEWSITKEEKNMILGVDVSGWNPNINWDSLYQGGVRFAVVKLTQGVTSVTNLAENHITNARRSGIVVAGYHWNDPMLDDNKQIDFFASHLKKYDIKLGYIDVEQYWQDWAEFYKSLKDGTQITKIISPTRISQSAYNMMTGLRNRGFKSQIYSRWSFIHDRSSPMKLWIPSEESWYAHYPYKSGRLNANWQDFLPGGAWYPTLPSPSLPTNVKWRIWQFSGDKFILPGTGGIPIDLNFFNGVNETELSNFFIGSNIPVPIPDPVEPPPVDPTDPADDGKTIKFEVISNELNIRTEPKVSSTTYTGKKLLKGSIVEFDNSYAPYENWIFDKNINGWVAEKHGGTQYLKRIEK